MFKKITVLLIVCCMIVSIVTPAFAEAIDETVTVEDMLNALERGDATETLEVIEFDELSDEDIAADPVLAQIIEDINYAPIPRSNYTKYEYGTLYIDTIIDATGNTLKYYSTPIARNFYVDVSHSGGSSEFATRFYVDEYILLNGDFVYGYMNRIKYKNMAGSIGLGQNISFGDTINISKAASAPCSINYLGLIGSLLSTQCATAASILSALSSINYNSQCTGSYSLSSSKNMIGCRFSGVTLDENEEFVKVSSFVSTIDSSRPTNVSVPVVFKWSFDVYKGTSKYTSASITGSYTVRANYSG